MAKSFLELVVGNLDEKKAWRQLIKRVDALPEDYRFAFKKILTQSDLLELFEESAAAGRKVTDIVGSDVAAFCDELIHASAADIKGVREKLNQEILNLLTERRINYGKPHQENIE